MTHEEILKKCEEYDIELYSDEICEYLENTEFVNEEIDVLIQTLQKLRAEYDQVRLEYGYGSSEVYCSNKLSDEELLNEIAKYDQEDQEYLEYEAAMKILRDKKLIEELRSLYPEEFR